MQAKMMSLVTALPLLLLLASGAEGCRRRKLLRGSNAIHAVGDDGLFERTHAASEDELLANVGRTVLDFCAATTGGAGDDATQHQFEQYCLCLEFHS